jgi:hypothetical protein
VINFSGTLTYIEVDAGGGRYAGTPLGQAFSGTFSYGAESEAATDPLVPGDYDFSNPPHSGLITDGMTATTSSLAEAVQVSIGDNIELDDEGAPRFNAVFGTSYVPGDTVDVADIDTQFELPSTGNIVFGLSFTSLSNTTFSGTDFDFFPPETGVIDRAIFFIIEDDPVSGEVIYGAIGVLDSVQIVPVQVVPIPAALWLFGSGLLGLIGIARRKT